MPTVQVQGLQRVEILSIVGGVICGDGHVVGGSGTAFGYPTILAGGVTVTFSPVSAVSSAQVFGAPWIAFDQDISVGGVPSEAQIGKRVRVFVVWIRPVECPTDVLILQPAGCS